MFKQNKYTKYYNSIINNAKSRTLYKCYYTEDHHIIPQSIGGNNEKANLVTLTGREHALCHWLLLKMTEGKNYEKMSYAFNFMMAKNLPRTKKSMANP